MLTRKEFSFLLILAMAGALFAYAVPDLILWIKPTFVDWFKYSIGAVVLTVAVIVIAFGIFLVWCCAKYGQYQAYQATKLYNDTNDIYDSEE